MLKWHKNVKGIHTSADLPAQWILDYRVSYKSRYWLKEKKVLGGALGPSNRGSDGSIPVPEAI